MSDISDQIKEIIDDFESFEDYTLNDTGDPDVVDLTVRGRLKKNIGRSARQKDSDYDRAMKGLSPLKGTRQNK